jgi:hypothetical protein
VPGHFTTLWKSWSTSSPSGWLAQEAAEYVYSAETGSVKRNINKNNHMGVTNRLTQQLDVIEFILTTIVSAPYKAIIRSNLQKENFLSI